MSEWLTTGQMIDRLKVGEKAESIHDSPFKVKRTNRGIVFSDGIPLSIDSIAIDEKWRILPNYVSFEEAMKVMKEGKTVYFHPKENERLVATMGNGMSWFDKYFWQELINGNWTVKED